jgi:iron complex outermembrane receptor protein
VSTPPPGSRHSGLIALCLGALVLSPSPVVAADADEPSQKNAAAIPRLSEQVTVTGTRLGTAATGQDVHVYDTPRIEQSGQSTVTDFLDTLPEVSLNSVESSQLATTVRLRGAILGSTLVLINGRRTQDVTSGAALGGYFDLNTIPVALVQRIEVLPTGSSAIYGGDALAGVVNIVLKSDFTGVTADAGYKFANNTDEKVISGGAGWTSGPLSLSIMGSYSDRSPLFGRDRDITANPDYRRFGGPNLGTQFFGAPANVSSVSGNLPGLGSSFAAVPKGSSGIGLTPADFAATAGLQNTGSFTSYQSTVHRSQRGGIFASANYRFDFGMELFAELLWSKYRLDVANTPPFLQLANVPASNPFNPFGAAVNVSGTVQGAESLARLTYDEDYLRPLIGARGDFGKWQWELTALNTHDKGSFNIYGQPNPALLNTALASSDRSAALNPFVDGPMGSSTLLASIYSNASITKYSGDTDIVNGFVRGSLLDLPAGSLNAVLGGEYEHSTLNHGFKASREVKAGFAELKAPLLSRTDDDGVKSDLLAVQIAGRYDDYSGFGSQATWQGGFELRPFDGTLLRGTHATSFRPPTLYNLAAPPLSSTFPLTDPQRNGAAVIASVATGGNSSLKPTTANSTTLGLAWSPREISGLNLSMTAWWLSIQDAINLPNPQYIVNNDSLYPGRVIRAAAPSGTVGQITSVDYSYVNFGAMREAGVDLNLDWTFGTEFGSFSPAIAATYITRFDGASTPGAPMVSRLSRANNDSVFAPRWKSTVSLAWDPGKPFKLWLAGRYIGPYVDYTPPHTIGDVWYLDASLQVDLVRALGLENPPLAGIKVLISGTNLTDSLPPYSTYFRGYDVYNYDLVGRTIFLRLQLQT